MSPNRIVVLVTPVAALAAGAAATWLADTVPGANVTAGQLEAVFVAGLAAVIAPAAHWLRGSQQYERLQQELERAALEGYTVTAAPAGGCELCRAGGGEDGGHLDLDDEYTSALDEPEPAASLGS
jgi:hypothetical protein